MSGVRAEARAASGLAGAGASSRLAQAHSASRCPRGTAPRCLVVDEDTVLPEQDSSVAGWAPSAAVLAGQPGNTSADWRGVRLARHCGRPRRQGHAGARGARIHKHRRGRAGEAAFSLRIPSVRGGPNKPGPVVRPAEVPVRCPRNTYSPPGHQGGSVIRAGAFPVRGSRRDTRRGVRPGTVAGPPSGLIRPWGGPVEATVQLVQLPGDVHRVIVDAVRGLGPWPRSTASRCRPS